MSAEHDRPKPPEESAFQIAVAQAADPLILTLDVGTSSVRAMLFDAAGRSLQGMAVHEAHQMNSTADGGVETDAETLLQRVVRCIDGVMEQAGPALSSRIAAVAPTTFWHNVLGVAGDGAPLTPLFTWADTRSAAAAAALRRELNLDDIHARTGCMIHPSYLPAKLRWLQQGRSYGRPSIHPRYWLSFAEFMTLRLFGSPSCSISMASGSGLMDQHRCAWDEQLLAIIPVKPSRLSPISDAPRHGLCAEFARRWPALATIPWFPGWGDGATSNTGCGALTRQRVAMMVGTSGAMRTVWRTKRIIIPPKLWCYRIDASRVVVGGALSNGGNLIDWLHSHLAVPQELDQVQATLANMEPDSHGLTFLPFLAGERSPNWASNARATISGLTLHSQPLEILRAGHEAVAYRFGLIYELLRQAVPRAGSAPEGIIASGGALLHAPFWVQIMADVLGRTVTASAVPEASSRGAALLALERLEILSNLEDLPPLLGEPYHPDHSRTRRYRAGAARQRALYDLLIAQHQADPQ